MTARVQGCIPEVISRQNAVARSSERDLGICLLNIFGLKLLQQHTLKPWQSYHRAPCPVCYDSNIFLPKETAICLIGA